MIPWFRTVRACADPQVRLVCFPHAGGSASFFRPWAAHTPPGVELLAVRYPGREDRGREPFATTMDELTEPLAAAGARLSGVPLVFFGHSMGATVAYATAARMARPPAALYVSGRSAPGHVRIAGLAGATDARLLDEVGGLGGTDPAVLTDPGLRELVLAVLRADYRLIEGYGDPGPVDRLPVPVVAYSGDADPKVDAPAVAAWSAVTSATFRVRLFPGGHFYLVDQAPALLADLFGQAPFPAAR